MALTLLVHYKNDQDRLAKIMDKLLDKEVHQLFKSPHLSSYFSNKPDVQPHIAATEQPPPQPPTTSTPQQQPPTATSEQPTYHNLPPPAGKLYP